ncbi:Riboflavin transporter 2 [Fasciola gigantica]|uniref:Riboflavin transporter n=1 Tax=Fasciola gigantica TaxID=46835 RepID=A0A504YR25_FASGI|nr:Riboflavin transporter 2 [Fasciola gigantica]
MNDVQFSWLPAFCVSLYGLGSWITVNGLWVELPVLVNFLPEGWNLPSYLSIIIQIANLGPLIYVPLTKFCRSSGHGFWAGCIQPPERLANYIILTVGFLSCILLANFWNAVISQTGVFAGKHSVGLLSLALCSALVDCTSSVTFVAYLTGMPEAYMGALTFGEAFSDIIPSAIALVQGVGGDPECVNITVNGTIKTVPQYPPPRFSVSLFMYFLAIIMGLCLIAFGLLDHMPWGLGPAIHRRYRTFQLVQRSCSPNPSSSANSVVFRPHQDDSSRRRNNRPDVTSVPVTVVRSDFLAATDPSTQGVIDEDNIGVSMPAGPVNRRNSDFFPKRMLLLPVFLLSYSCLLTYGLLPGFQSYSTASYSATTYHLAAALSGLSCALVIIVTTCAFHHVKRKSRAFPVVHELLDKTDNALNGPPVGNPSAQNHSHLRKSYAIWMLFTILFSVPAGYIVYLAHTSPTPPHLQGVGPLMAVLSWILVRAGFGGLRTWWWLHLSSHSGETMTLRLAGLASQMGAAVGAVISFLLIVYFNFFQSKQFC